jgi:hypothetical protein
MIPEVLQDIWNANAALSRMILRIEPLLQNPAVTDSPELAFLAPDWLKFHAVKLDIWLILLTNYTFCRESIHFFCSKIRRSIVAFCALDANLYNKSNCLSAPIGVAWFLRFP